MPTWNFGSAQPAGSDHDTDTVLGCVDDCTPDNTTAVGCPDALATVAVMPCSCTFSANTEQVTDWHTGVSVIDDTLASFLAPSSPMTRSEKGKQSVGTKDTSTNATWTSPSSVVNVP